MRHLPALEGAWMSQEFVVGFFGYFFNKLLENKKAPQSLHQHLLIHQPNQKPEWGVVKADDSFIICFGFTIIPRAAAAFFQEGAGAVFGEENTCLLYTSDAADD